MFGYLKPDTPYLYLKDDTLYKALYCAVCKSIGQKCGQLARLGLTYDIAFMSAFIHNVSGKDVDIERKRCVAHWIKPRPIAKTDKISDLCAYINVSLAYYKIQDDINDGEGGKIKRLLFAKGNRRSKKEYSQIAKVVEGRYAELSALEKQECSIIDASCEPFARMMVELGDIAMLGEKREGVEKVFYFLGKWIYLIDALDDYDKDLKEKSYNPFYYAYGKSESFETLIKENGEDITFLFSSVFSGLEEGLKECRFEFNSDLIENVIRRGIPQTTIKIFGKTSKKEKEKSKNGK